ncbi:XRE family transcriptional regulator [Bradyrhizobium sp. SZCCHNR2028]|uniref:XRE family transcriptional regulator n=1 Tax=Bradyrhizobium sp. SZCCHNR2028 TaxID=3057382 RepID=UPI0028E41E3B|nr:XRE family transcriptional regulator [Bradyrhizobium sp. SZCCHNR2028]
MGKKFNGRRFGIARKRRLLNKRKLADVLGVSEYTVMRYEAGKTVPADDMILVLGKTLGFPVEFFFGDDVDEPLADAASFRSQTSMTAGVRDAALAAGSIGFLISDYVEARFDLPKIAVPNLEFYSPEEASRVLRQDWALGERAISNMIHLLESKGVRVFSLAENSLKVNAFSLWREGKPYIFLNTMKSPESSRFDAAHELGHLVLHQDGKPRGREAEDEANRFASCFLMPEADVLAQIPYVHSLNQIIEQKARWKVSVAALNYRLRKLGVTTEWQNRNFCIQIAERGFNKNEPFPIEREMSVVWDKVLKSLWADRITRTEIARDLNLPPSEVDSMIFGVLGKSTPRPDARKLSAI